MADKTPPIIPTTNDSDVQANPLFLNSGDNPNLILVSQTLNAENYPS